MVFGSNWSSLSKAIEFENIDMIKILIDSGAEVNQIGNGGCTPLCEAINKDRIEIVQILISNSGNCYVSG